MTFISCSASEQQITISLNKLFLFYIKLISLYKLKIRCPHNYIH